MKLQGKSIQWYVATLLVALAGGTVTLAQAEGRHGHGGMGGGIGGGMGMHMSERMLDSVNATPEQRTQIKQIMQGAMTDLAAQREAGRALRMQAMTVFTQPNVDANAAEALRQQMLARHDQASKRMMQAMLETSRVLTPDQRRQLAEGLAKRQEMMQRHQRERGQMDKRI